VIGIREITRGRFGNRILQYNSLMQLSRQFSIDAYCSEWEGHQWFEDIVKPQCSDIRPCYNITWKEVLSGEYLRRLENNEHCVIGEYVMHNFFYDITKLSPKIFLKLKKEYLPVFPSDSKNIGIHIRGDDIRGADGNNCREVHSFQYYRDAIDLIASKEKIDSVHLCTDDTDFDLFVNVESYACEVFGRHNVHRGKSTLNRSLPHIFDFGTLSECDYLVASSSTYAVTAGFIGKRKKIIHSEDWINKNTPGQGYVAWGKYTSDYPAQYWTQYDKFWQRVREFNSEHYEPWAIV